MITEYREVFSVTPEEEEGDGDDEEILLISPNTDVSPKIVEEDLVGQVFQSQRRKSQNEDSGG